MRTKDTIYNHKQKKIRKIRENQMRETNKLRKKGERKGRKNKNKRKICDRE